MEVQLKEKKRKKPAKTTAPAVIRVSKETRQRMDDYLASLKKVKPDKLIMLALSLVQAEHLQQLQESSLSEFDRFKRAYTAYVAQNGPITEDKYFGLYVAGRGQVNAP